MKIIFLGTGTSHGVPVPACKCNVCCSKNPKDNRLRSSLYIEHQEIRIIIDTGPDFRQQVLRSGIDNVDAILYTHEHQDHTAGLDDVRSFNLKYKKSIPVYATSNVEKRLREMYGYIFTDQKYPGIPDITIVPIKNKAFKIQHLTVTPIEVLHHRLPILGFRIGDFTYITDASYIAPEEIKKIKNSKVIVVNALRQDKHFSHFNLEEAVAFLQQLQPEMGYLIHMNHQMGLHEKINASLPSNIRLAYDGLNINIS